MTETVPGTRPRNRRGEGGRLREEIVDAAVALLDETGDEQALSLRSIARRAGVSAPSIYPHFADQPAIMLAVVRRAWDELDRALRRAVEDASDADAAARLTAACHAYLDFALEHPGRYRTLFGGLWRPPADSSVTDDDLTGLGAASTRLLADLLAECVAAGLSDAEPGVDVYALWLGLHGLAHQRAVNRVFPGPADIADRIIPALARLRPAST